MIATDASLSAFAAASYTAVPTFHGAARTESIRAVVSTEGDGLVVAFPGSVTLNDWLEDFKAMPVSDSDITTSPHGWIVHQGFLEAADSVFDPVRDAVAGKPYALTGHSLGGAIALLIGATLAARYDHPPIRITTFGAPRVGLGGYVDATRSMEIYEFRFGNDIVTQVPTFLEHAKGLDPIRVGEPRLDFLSCHHLPNYIAAITARGT